MSSRICACLFRCNGYDDCTMTFSRSEHLARHVRKHTGERPFYCHCGRAFSRLDNVRQHATTVHGDQREENSTMMTALVALHVTLSHAAIISQREQGMIIPKGLKSETSIDFNSSGDEKKVRKSERAKKVKKAKKERQLSNYSESSAGGRQKIIRLSPPPTLPSPHPSPRVVVHQSFKQPPSQHASPQHSLPQHHSPHPTSPAKLNTMPQLSAAQFAYASSAYYSNSEAPASVNDSPISPFYSVRASPSSDRDSGPPPILTSAVRFYSPMFYGNQGTNLNSTNLVEESLLSRGGVTLPSISELLPSPFTRSSDDNKRIGEVQEAIYYEPLSDTVTVKMEPSFTTYSNLECQISSPTETYYEESYDGDSYEEEDIKPEPHQLQNSLYYGSTHSNPGSNYIYSVPNSFHYPTPQYIQPHPSNSIGIDYLNQTPRLYASAMSAMISRESSERSTNSYHHQYPQSPHPTPIPLESTSYYMAPSYETYPPIHYSNISNKRYEYTQYGALGVGPMRIDENHYQQGYAKRLREETEGDEREYKRFSSYGRI